MIRVRFKIGVRFRFKDRVRFGKAFRVRVRSPPAIPWIINGINIFETLFPSLSYNMVL